MISESYKKLLKEKVTACPNWGCTGHKCAHEALGVMAKMAALSAIDYGCGTGSLGASMKNLNKHIKVTNYDPARPEWDRHPNSPKDIVLCVDVMEHVEEEHVDAVIADIADLCRTGAYFVIDCRKAVHILPDGRNAHITIKPQHWWTRRLTEHFKQVTCFRVGRNGRTLHYECWH